MKGPVRRYLSEHAVNLFSGNFLLLQASELMSDGVMQENQKAISDNCHIYLIGRRPLLHFCPETFAFDNGIVSGNVVYAKCGERKLVPFSVEFPLWDGAVRLELSAFPHREFWTYNAQGEKVRQMSASALTTIHGLHVDLPDLCDVEVLYIGQAYGNGNRAAFDRLKSHSTLQKILADVQYRTPESEIYLLLFEYHPYRIITMMDGMADAEVTGHEDTDRFFSIINNPLDKKQQICLTEAALIRYFQPPYNKIYRDNFPSNKHKILEGCYKLDFSGLVAEINTDELMLKLYSEAIEPSLHHISKVNLVGHENRCGFFHMSDGKGGFQETMQGVLSEKSKGK